jgi:hypothetical protein
MERKLDFSALAETRAPDFFEWLTGKVDSSSQAAYRRMALANEFNYVSADKRFIAGAGVLFARQEARCLNIFSGTFIGLPFHLFHAAAGAESGFATVFRFTLPRLLPHVVIDSHVDSGSILPLAFTSEQRVALEGDFARYFTTYAPRTYEQSMVNILAPDIMQVLLAYAAHCDIEIVDNYMYFYWPYTLHSPQDVQKIFQTAHAVMYQLHDKLSRSDIYGTPRQQQSHEEGSRGVRLQKKKKTILQYFFDVAPLVIGGFLIVKPEFMPQFVEGYANLLFVLLPIFGASLLYSFLKKRQLRKELDRRNNFN